MARRAAGPAGPLHSAQDPAPGERGADHRADAPPDGVAPAGPGTDAHPADAEDLERLRASLLHGRAAHAPPLRVEDPVHPPASGTGRSGQGWSGQGWSGAGWAAGWPDDASDPDGLAGDESAVMHPDDLAALHALPTTTAETRAWGGGTWEPDQAWATHDPEPAAPATGGRLVGAAPGLSVWDDGDSWDDPSFDDEPAVGLLQQRWLQLTVCALLALVVGAALALLLTGRQVDAARAETDRQRQIAASAQADLVRERTARASEQADDTAPPPSPAAPPAPAAPPDDLPQAPEAGVDPSVVAPPPPSDQQRPPVAEAPAPTADPGPPPPGPSPAATAPPDGQGGAAPSSQSPAQDAPVQDAPVQDTTTGTTQTDGQECTPVDGTGGDGPATCP